MADAPFPLYRPPNLPLAPLALEESRERAVRLLSDAYAYDRLSESEFEWRLGRLGATQNAAAVDALVADLLSPAATNVGLAAPLPTSRRLLAVMCSSRYAGDWIVPERLDVAAVMSEVRIDLRYATLPPACTIHIGATMANVAITVPPGMAVQFDVGAFMGTSRSDARTRGLGSGGPLVTVTGFAFMAEVRVRVREP